MVPNESILKSLKSSVFGLLDKCTKGPIAEPFLEFLYRFIRHPMLDAAFVISFIKYRNTM